MNTPTLSLKLLVDKKASKVLFAEAGKDFVDFLFNLLSLPIGTVIRALTNGSMVGCIGNLYESLEKLNEAYMQPNQNKDSLLNPSILTPATEVPLMLPESDLQPMKRKLYFCPNHHPCVTDHKNIKCMRCSCNMSEEVEFIRMNDSPANSTSQGGYVKGLVTYMVTDDLSVSIMSMITGVALLNKFNVKDFGVLEEKVVEFGIDQGVELLKASLQSKAALTSVFLVNKEVKDGALN
ncbi:hypothetical protein P3X46_014195 [Hevea brasiliensis]|uniref:DUF674 domain-containing protein n=1 Tax=Hevea brasiliensis TaxID=3981 RepID=A0ABQ9M9K2_HEVBR|nr:uncharacterized protein LOC110662720 [Hevea brasiliensis]XP_058008063.1 uncharacterized protein LOC110662720 [Hevea brasiliensis]KAJ9175660.1 hypothetical protein P3X46_014195 [Hevea brasiliensis]